MVKVSAVSKQNGIALSMDGLPVYKSKRERFADMLRNARSAASDTCSKYYAKDEYLKDFEKADMAISHSMLQKLLEYADNASDRDLLFDILFKEKQESEKSKKLTFTEGCMVPEQPDHILPLTSKEAFRKYLSRAKKKGIRESLISALRGQKSNRTIWTEILKSIVILYAVHKATKCSSNEIYNDLEHLLEDHPDIVRQGVHLVKPSTIRKFLKNEGKAYISFAKDNPTDFKRKILGVLRFIPPSAPLVRIGVDGYTFQVICEGDDTGKACQLSAQFIIDFKSKVVLGLAFGKENNITFRKAFLDMFRFTNNQLAREIVMDKFSAHTCKHVTDLNKLFANYKLDIIRSSNPNNNSIAERLFGSLQNLSSSVLGSSYIGSSITSKSENARPAKKVLITMRRKEFLKGESEIIHVLTHLIKEVYNKRIIVRKGKSPMDLYNEQKANPKAVLSDEEVACATFEKHQNSIVGCGVFIKKGDYLFLYKQRSLQVATKFFKHKVFAYINRDNPTDDAYIYSAESGKFLFKMKHVNIVPCSIFDRTEEQKAFVRNYNKETRELVLAIEKNLEIMETAVETLLKGKSLKETTLAAKIKHEANEAYLPAQIGLTDLKPEPPAAFANTIRNRKPVKKPKVTHEEMLAKKFNL